MSTVIEQLRVAGRESLIAFSQITYPGYQPSWHHRLIADALHRVADGRCKRLLILMPPRHGKTELASIRFAPWLLARRPATIVAATYAQDYADDLGRKARAVMQSTIYRGLYPHASLHTDSRAISRWSTRHGGSYYGVGVGGALTGRGADFIIIDDPHKNRAEAESQLVRDAVWDWYRSTAYTRLEPGGAVVLVLTHWHEDDIAARVMEGDEHWEILRLPAVAEEEEEHRHIGEALWPTRYPIEVLRQIEQTVGEREWAALYQQRPAAAHGILFRPDAIQTIEAEPAGVTWVRAWDFGATAKGDPTVGAKLAMRDGRAVIGDVVRMSGPPEEVERVLLATAQRDGHAVAIDLPQDPGQAGKAQVQSFTKLLAGFRVTSSPETGSKTLRAEPLAAQVNVGNVSMVRGSWNRRLIDEMRSFPVGQHDDQVDALSRAYNHFVRPSNTAVLDLLTQRYNEMKEAAA